ncbi:MAG: GNAT family N-acetyltransferase [Polyangiaceae bacterium]|nr:GNAT family N-acetyltransferase [Polyangiaceae bacterium]
MYQVAAAAPVHKDGLIALFKAAESPCFCRFWHFTGTNNDWLDKCANQTAQNEAELAAALQSNSPEAGGVVAVEQLSNAVVGWMKLAPAEAMRKAYDRRLYKNLPCFEGDRKGIYTIGCFLIHPEHKKRGLSTLLVNGGISVARSRGATAIEAFPRRPKEPVRDDELWTGPIGAFEKNGFVEVNSFEPYPVLRLTL